MLIKVISTSSFKVIGKIIFVGKKLRELTTYVSGYFSESFKSVFDIQSLN
ncbi:hypothetical protein HNP63_001114 [Borreliella afzelii]|uniref:Uncharacterized protein n=1 Tax=Borreliella afzelii TaxID=29518 RepID=A0AB34Z3F2_BORAF|nr:hypothetical protein [Borreliella afzelii]